MQHNIHYQDVSQLNDAVKLLNMFGALSSALLMMKFRVTIDEAREILKEIVEHYDNVVKMSTDRIYIEGREPEEFKHKYKTPRKPRKNKYQDITKP